MRAALSSLLGDLRVTSLALIFIILFLVVQFNDWRPYHKDSELMKHDDEGRRVFEEAKIKMKESKTKTKASAAPAETNG